MPLVAVKMSSLLVAAKNSFLTERNDTFSLYTPFFGTESKFCEKMGKKYLFLLPKARKFFNFCQKWQKGFFGGQKGKKGDFLPKR